MRNFKSLGDFERFMLRRVAALETGMHVGLDVAASIVEKTAKDEIGHYQEAAGDFEAWAELSDATKEDRVGQGYSENEPLLRDGTLRDSISRKVEGFKAVVGSDSDIMVWQEEGTPNAAHPIPPRPVLGLAGFRCKDEVVNTLGQTAVAVLTGKRLPK